MKRILCLLLVLLMILPLASCTSQISEGGLEEGKTTAEETATAEKKEETATKAKIELPEGFSAGYAKVNITPKVELPIYDASVSVMHDPLYLTCTAVSDGEKVALLMSADVKKVSANTASSIINLIEKNFDIPREMIMISATHTHSAPSAAGSGDNMVLWLGQVYKQAIVCVQEALEDLAPAEAYAGVSHTDGINFVRRYKLASGAYDTNPKLDQADPPVEHESEADNELRTIRLAREGKKDILMMNYQTHYALYVKAYSADFVAKLREYAEKDLDVNFVYYSGASGNLNMTAKFPGEWKAESKEDAVKKMWETAKAAVSKEVKLNTGKVVGVTSMYEAKVLKNTKEEISRAKELKNRWAEGVLTRAELGDTEKIPFTGISFGDIAFTASPIEQFDANAKWVRDNSPFKMTFSLSMTNAYYGYVPTAEAFPHGAYEVHICRYVPGSGEEFAAEQLRLLNECYHAQ